MPRKVGSIIIALLAGGSIAVRADTIEFIAKLHGHIQTAGVRKVISVTETNFVAPGNQLLVQVNLDFGTIVFVEASANPTNSPRTLLQPYHSAVMTNRNSITVTLVPNGGGTLPLQGGLVFGGELSGAGTVSFSKGHPRGFRATLTGIWNDPMLGNTAAPAAIFRGTVVGRVSPSN